MKRSCLDHHTLRQRLRPLGLVEIAAADPQQRDELFTLVVVQRGDRLGELLARRIVGIIGQDAALAVIGGIRAGIGLDLLDLDVVVARQGVARKKNAFHEYAKSQGKLGGQNKTPRLANDRKIADLLEIYKL